MNLNSLIGATIERKLGKQNKTEFNGLAKIIHSLIPGSCECGILHGEFSFWKVIKDKDLEMGKLLWIIWMGPPTPVAWSGEFHGQRRLVGYGHKELDTTEAT